VIATAAATGRAPHLTLAAEHQLPFALLSHYLFFLTRRPISQSNRHYLESRLLGLKSLREELARAAVPEAETALQLLAALQPASFQRLAPGLQLALLPFMRATAALPRDVVVADGPPAGGLEAGVRRVLLVLGPGIGIGDEIMLFPLPRWLREARPHCQVTVLTAYPGLWDRVLAVERVLCYSGHLELLRALRGEAPYDGYDLHVLADFESPELHSAICAEGRPDLFLELSIGHRSAWLVDNRRRWLHRMVHATPYFENYYSGLHQVLRCLGLSPHTAGRFDGLVGRQDARPREALRIFASPFTSKYNPSQSYWNRLLGALAAGGRERPLILALDAGKNAVTERFAIALRRALAARVPAGVTVEIARSEGSRFLSLPGVFRELEAAHAVVCTDSFAAHAAPLFGCTTLVVATAGLENWRVPFAGSYYFRAEDRVDEVGVAMRQALGGATAAQLSQAESRLVDLSRRLEELFDAKPADAAAFRAAYLDFARTHRLVIEGLHRYPPELAALLYDVEHQAALRSPEADGNGGAAAPAMMLHLRDQWERWQNSNLRKFLRRSAEVDVS
jgi:ADP-heptose:LPS heptosyltransferase